MIDGGQEFLTLWKKILISSFLFHFFFACSSSSPYGREIHNFCIDLFICIFYPVLLLTCKVPLCKNCFATPQQPCLFHCLGHIACAGGPIHHSTFFADARQGITKDVEKPGRDRRLTLLFPLPLQHFQPISTQGLQAELICSPSFHWCCFYNHLEPTCHAFAMHNLHPFGTVVPIPYLFLCLCLPSLPLCLLTFLGGLIKGEVIMSGGH